MNDTAVDVAFIAKGFVQEQPMHAITDELIEQACKMAIRILKAADKAVIDHA